VIVDGIVVHERTYRQPIHRLWRAFTQRAELATWLMANDSTAQVGTTFRFDGGEQLGIVEAKVVESIPPRHLVWEWTFHRRRSRVTIDLTETGNATSLRLEHRMLDADEASGFDSGWADKLDRDLPALLTGEYAASETVLRNGLTSHPRFENLTSAIGDEP
jgi:uncharacterized protein YndB with AHSA1/START domain